MSVFKNMRIGFKFSGLEGCSLLLFPPEVFFHIDCRLRNVGTKIRKYQKIHKYYLSIKIVEKCFLSHRCLKTWGFIQNTSKLENFLGGGRKVSIRKCCYDTLWGLVASGIHLCEWLSTFPADWLRLLRTPPSLHAFPLLNEGCCSALWQTSLRCILGAGV